MFQAATKKSLENKTTSLNKKLCKIKSRVKLKLEVLEKSTCSKIQIKNIEIIG
jgi:hypothetical protein